MKNLDDLLNHVNIKNVNITMGVIVSEEISIIETAISACQWVKVNLYGEALKIVALFQQLHQQVPAQIKIINCINTEATIKTAMQDVVNKDVQILMKGNVSTKLILQAILDKQYKLYDSERILSHVAVVQVDTYKKWLLVSDCALNINPNMKQFIGIINNTLELSNLLAIEHPNIALLAAIEKVNEKMPITNTWNTIKNLENEWLHQCNLAGPLALDNAISKEAAAIKGITSKVAGNADILIVPNIESGNILYKSLVYFAKAKVADVIMGAKIPIVLTSRADNVQNKLHSIKLAIYLAIKKQGVN